MEDHNLSRRIIRFPYLQIHSTMKSSKVFQSITTIACMTEIAAAQYSSDGPNVTTSGAFIPILVTAIIVFVLIVSVAIVVAARRRRRLRMNPSIEYAPYRHRHIGPRSAILPHPHHTHVRPTQESSPVSPRAHRNSAYGPFTVRP